MACVKLLAITSLGNKLVHLALSLMLLLFASSAGAIELPRDGDQVLPCRPTVSCTANLAAPGTAELESGFLFQSDGATGNQSSFPFLTKFTFSRWFQLQIGSNGYTISQGAATERYLDDMTVGGKVHFLGQSETLPSLSFSLTASLPTAGNQNGYVRAYDALFTFYASRDFGPIHADFNFGVDLLSIGHSPLTQEFVSLALTYGLSKRWSLEAESYYFTDANPISANDSGFRSAITYALKPWLVFDFGGDIGFIPSTRIYSAFTGISLIPLTF